MTAKRKLFLISPMLHQGGFERVCITTAKLLKEEYDITIVIFDDANIAYDVTGLNIVNLDCPVRNGKIAKIANVIKRSSKLRALKKTKMPEISYSFGPTANIVNSLSAVPGVKTWTGLRNYTDVLNVRNMKLFMKKSDVIVCCSKEIEAYLASNFDYHKTATLYNLYDLETIDKESEGEISDWPWPEETDEQGNKLRIMVSMGRDDDQKCFWHMIKAFYHIHNAVPAARLVLLGAGSFENSKALAKELGIYEYIFFAGMRKDPYKFLGKAEIYLLTSYNEGFPNALVEGMSLGLAPVATDCLTGPKEILTPSKTECYGVLTPLMSEERNYDSRDLDEEKPYADEVINLLMNEDLLKEKQELAKKRAADFSYESYKERFIELTNL